MSGVSIGTNRFSGDDGSAQPRVTAALAAFASGQGSEHSAVESLASIRLLVPVVAVAVAPGEQGEPAGCDDSQPDGRSRELSEMSMPTLVGHDGRRAVPAFTSLDALARWRPDARPVPTEAAAVWQAAMADGCAVVVDVAGPVPLAIDGARLAALAGGAPVPPAHEDPDVLAAVHAAAAGLAGLDRAGTCPGADGSDLGLRLKLTAGTTGAAAQQTAGALAEAVLARLPGRLRRGITITLETPAPT